jgi:hypothetical protein
MFDTRDKDVSMNGKSGRPHSSRRGFFKAIVGLGMAGTVASSTGCVSLAANLMYMIKGNTYPAKCTAMEGKKVAVVVVDNATLSGSGGHGDTIARMVTALLQKKVKKIQTIRTDDVAQWRDANNWNEVEYGVIGKGLKADLVLGIDLESYTIHDNPTLLRGRSRIRYTLYDINDNNNVLFRDGPKEHVYPENAGRHAVESESEFQGLYVAMLSRSIAKDFYEYDKVEDVASDAAFLAN